MNRVKNLDEPSGPKVFLVPVPIGNEKDITLRAIEVLREADLICSEDTRTTGKLLDRLNIQGKESVSLYSQVEAQKAKTLIERIKESGEILAFCSDAGTPGISDPGSVLVRTAIDEGIRVTALPGACAAITALVISGLDTADFSFYGFLSDKPGTRRGQLQRLVDSEIPMIFYESPNRVIETLKDMRDILGPKRRFALLRELTKVHEEAIRGTLEEIEQIEPSSIRGECVICVEGAVKKAEDSRGEVKRLYRIYRDNQISDSLASKLISEQLGLKRNGVYKLIQALSGTTDKEEMAED